MNNSSGWQVQLRPHRPHCICCFTTCLASTAAHSFGWWICPLTLSYVIRVTGEAWIECPGYKGNLCDYPLSVGQPLRLSRVLYHETKCQRLKMALSCVLIKGKASAWLLATDLPLSARQTVNIYSLCFWCEESFRDQKQALQLESVRVQQARRLENLLSTLAIASSWPFLVFKAENFDYTIKFAARKKERKSSPGFRWSCICSENPPNFSISSLKPKLAASLCSGYDSDLIAIDP